jgi:CBS domain-containing protein
MLLRMRRPRAAHALGGRWAEGCLTVRTNDSVADAVRLMAAHEVGCLAVTDPAVEHVAGLLTERQYSRNIVLEGRSSDTTRVAEVMSTRLVCVNVEEKLDVIADVLSVHRIRHLPVVGGTEMEGAPGQDHILRCAELRARAASADGYARTCMMPSRACSRLDGLPWPHVCSLHRVHCWQASSLLADAHCCFARRLPAPVTALRGVLSVKDVAWMLFCLVRNELQGCAMHFSCALVRRVPCRSADADTRCVRMRRHGIGSITVRDMMSRMPLPPQEEGRQHLPPFSIHQDCSVLDAIREMARLGSHALVVVDDAGALCGIITERDYIQKLKVVGRTSEDTPVSEVMTSTPWCASLDFTLDDVLTVRTSLFARTTLWSAKQGPLLTRFRRRWHTRS